MGRERTRRGSAEEGKETRGKNNEPQLEVF